MQNAQVVSHRTLPYFAAQIGCVNRPAHKVSANMRGHFAKNKVEPKHRIAEFRVQDQSALPTVGSLLSAAHFVPGQFIDVQSQTIGKGFAGPMKRHGFKGLRASHGVSISHRSGGSTGQHQDPGRVFPGKKMAGHMGCKLRTVQNLLLLRIDLANNLVYCKGAVPGAAGAYVRITDALKRKVTDKDARGVAGLPFPAGTVDLIKDLRLPDEIELATMR